MALTSPETFTEQDKADLLGAVDEVASILGPSRPSPAKVTRARTLVKDIRVTCQTIPVSPITDDGTVTPPTPGPETPPIEPAPHETPPSGGGGGGSSSPPTTTTVTTTYTSQGDFSGSQGYRGWYYLSEDGTSMTYSAGSQLWLGTELYQGIWSSGQHPGGTNGAMRRWVAQGTGTYAITGQISDADLGGPGNNVTVTIKKNGAAIYGPQTITSGDATGYAISSVTGNCTAADTFDILVNGVGGISFASTNVSVSIALTTTTTSGSGSTTQTTLPFILSGTAPEEGTYTITANKPSNADGCTIAITGVNLAASYGRLYFNGSTNSLAIWATAPANAGISATVTLTVPVAYMVNGSNTLRFTHDSGTGYTVTAIGTPTFTTPATPTPPATQTSLPFDLRGSILPEDGILTVPLSKPSNANGATMTVTGVNLTGTMGSYYINGTLASSVWTTVPANAGVSATVTRTPDVNLFVNGNNAIRFTHTAGSGYTVSSVNVAFSTPSPGTDPGPPAGNNGTFLNEPAGLTTVLNHGFDTVLGPGMSSPYPPWPIVSDATAPLSPPNCYRSVLPAGSAEGGSELHFDLPRAYRQMFMGIYWRTNPQFQGRPNSNKTFFLRGPEANGCWIFGNSALVNGSAPLIFGHNTGGGLLDNSHACAGDLGLACYPNAGDGTLHVGTWTKIEAYVKASTTNTSRDGIVRWWINGVLVGNYTNLNYGGQRGLTEWVWSETWDGGVSPLPSVQWEHYLDHLYLSVGD